MSRASENLIEVISAIDRIIDESHIKTLNGIILKIKKSDRISIAKKFIEECDEILKKVEDFRAEISSQI